MYSFCGSQYLTEELSSVLYHRLSPSYAMQDNKNKSLNIWQEVSVFLNYLIIGTNGGGEG